MYSICNVGSGPLRHSNKKSSKTILATDEHQDDEIDNPTSSRMGIDEIEDDIAAVYSSAEDDEHLIPTHLSYDAV